MEQFTESIPFIESLSVNQFSEFFFEMIYVYSGNAVNQLADNFIPLETGDVCILAPNVSHSLNVFSDSIIINILIN